jgi:hypothetical protein
MQESMPLAQSTAMDEEYGKTVQPEETYTGFFFFMPYWLVYVSYVEDRVFNTPRLSK